jgi:hypothetical protein
MTLRRKPKRKAATIYQAVLMLQRWISAWRNLMNDIWKTFRVDVDEGEWEPASYNVQWVDGREYGRWRRVLRQHSHGLTVVSRYTAPPGKAWKIIGKASELGEEVYILEGNYYDTRGRIVAGPGTYMSMRQAPSTAGFPATSPSSSTVVVESRTISSPSI